MTFALSPKIIFCHSKSYFDIRTETENPILIFKILFWHSHWENPILIFKILFWHSHWVRIYYFDIQNPILTFALRRKILFWYSKSYFDIRTEWDNPILTFKILFWHLQWAQISYFDIQNPILTFALSLKILFWLSKSYFDIRTESENRSLIFDIQNPILTFAVRQKILFWYSKSHFGIALRRKISYFDIQIWRSKLVLLVEYFIYLTQTSTEQSNTASSDIFSTDVTDIKRHVKCGWILPSILFLCDKENFWWTKHDSTMDFGCMLHVLSGLLGRWIFMRTPSAIRLDVAHGVATSHDFSVVHNF